MSANPVKIIAARQLSGQTQMVLRAEGDNFVSKPVEYLRFDYGGIAGDIHHGLTRASGSREPWYKRGTPMRNERQISIVSVEEMEEIRLAMGIERLEAGWIGANLVLSGIDRLSLLPPRTLLMFDGGVTLRIDGSNAPCRFAGGEIANACGVEAPLTDGKPDFTRSDLALSFVKAAHRKRGLVAWVEREGEVKPGEALTVRIWEQWLYE